MNTVAGIYGSYQPKELVLICQKVPRPTALFFNRSFLIRKSTDLLRRGSIARPLRRKSMNEKAPENIKRSASGSKTLSMIIFLSLGERRFYTPPETLCIHPVI